MTNNITEWGFAISIVVFFLYFLYSQAADAVRNEKQENLININRKATIKLWKRVWILENPPKYDEEKGYGLLKVIKTDVAFIDELGEFYRFYEIQIGESKQRLTEEEFGKTIAHIENWTMK